MLLKKILIIGVIITVVILLGITFKFFIKDQQMSLIKEVGPRTGSLKVDDKSILTEDKDEQELEYFKKTYFSIRVGKQLLTLFDKKDEKDLEILLGKPNSSELIVENTYPYEGFKGKDLSYEGIKINLVKGKTENDFWINRIVVESPKFLTSQNIKTGDNVDSLKKQYLGIETRGSIQENNLVYSFRYRDPCPLFIEFQIINGKIARIEMFWEWP